MKCVKKKKSDRKRNYKLKGAFLIYIKIGKIKLFINITELGRS